MVSQQEVEAVEKGAFPRRVPALVVYLSPFRLVQASTLATWSVNIEQVNTGKWDYVQLHEVAGGINVGLNAPYHMLVGRDGALALPPVPELRDHQKAIEFFNRCFAALLLGGIYCEAVTLDNLELGSIIDWKYIRVPSNGKAASNRLHGLFRTQSAPPVEAIELMNPRIVGLWELANAMETGLSAFSTISHLSGEFLVKGVSGVARRDWGVAISNLWITIEQLTTYLWERDITQPLQFVAEPIDGRRDQLRDTRSWTAALRQELLYQKGSISASTLKNLFIARKARNDLVHQGKHPTEQAAMAAYEASKGLLGASLPGSRLPLFELDISNHMMTDPFAPRKRTALNPLYWMPIPKLPGEEELEKQEAMERQDGSDGK